MRPDKSNELPAMPARDAIGQAAVDLIDAEDRFQKASVERDALESKLFKIMRKQGRKRVQVDGYIFSLRVRPTRQIVAITKRG